MDVEIFGRKLWIYGIQGRVSGLRAWTETHTTISGGQVRDSAHGGLQVDAHGSMSTPPITRASGSSTLSLSESLMS